MTGMLSMLGGVGGMIGGLFGAKEAASPGIAPQFYQLSGTDQQTAARAEATSLSTQSALAYEQALQDAAQREREVRQFREEQALRFASSGITLQGSPLGVLEETRALGAQEVDAIRARGLAVSGLLESQGLQMLRQGSSAAFGGFAQSLQSRFEAENRSANIRSQAFQTGISGISAGLQGLGGSGGSSGIRNFASGFFSAFRPSSGGASGFMTPTDGKL